MKKYFSFIFIFFSLTLLIGCGNKKIDIDNNIEQQNSNFNEENIKIDDVENENIAEKLLVEKYEEVVHLSGKIECDENEVKWFESDGTSGYKINNIEVVEELYSENMFKQITEGLNQSDVGFSIRTIDGVFYRLNEGRGSNPYHDSSKLVLNEYDDEKIIADVISTYTVYETTKEYINLIWNNPIEVIELNSGDFQVKAKDTFSLVNENGVWKINEFTYTE